MTAPLPRDDPRSADRRNPFGYDWSPADGALRGAAFLKAITRPLSYTRFDFFFNLPPATHGPAYGWGGPAGRPPKPRKKPWGRR